MNNNTEPLNKSVKTQLSFKGSNSSKAAEKTTGFFGKIIEGFNTLKKEIFYEQQVAKKSELQTVSNILKDHFSDEVGALTDDALKKASDEIILEPGIAKRILNAVIGPFILIKDVAMSAFDKEYTKNLKNEVIAKNLSVLKEKLLRVENITTPTLDSIKTALEAAEKDRFKSATKLEDEISHILQKTEYQNIEACLKGAQNLTIEQIKKLEDIKKIPGVEAILNNTEIKDAKKLASNVLEAAKKHFLKNDDLYNSLQVKRFLEQWQGKGAQYGVTGASVTNRLVAGAISAAFLGVDFYNTTRMLTDDDKKAKGEAIKRLGQEFFRIGITLYMLFGVNKLLDKANNKSIPFAIFTNALVVAVSEAVGRKLIGNDLLPMSKQRFDHLKATGKLYSKKEIESQQKAVKEQERLDNPPVYAKKLSLNGTTPQGKISNINTLKMISGGV